MRFLRCICFDKVALVHSFSSWAIVHWMYYLIYPLCCWIFAVCLPRERGVLSDCKG